MNKIIKHNLINHYISQNNFKKKQKINEKIKIKINLLI